MRRFFRWQLVAVLALVFLAGGVAGSLTTVILLKRGLVQGLKFEHWTDAVMKTLRQDLQLTPDQEPKVRALVEETGRQLKATLDEGIAQSGRIVVELGRNLDRELTPEQRMIRQRKEDEFRQRLKEDLEIELPAR
jgi:hypothetical protein